MFYLRISILLTTVIYLIVFAVRNSVLVNLNIPLFGASQDVHIIAVVLIAMLAGMIIQYLISFCKTKKKKKK